MGKIIYDIRSNSKAVDTLVNITGIPLDIWDANSHKVEKFYYQDDFIEYMLSHFGSKNIIKSYTDFEFIISHITTSKEECKSFSKYGILDLKQSYQNETELRLFLDKHNIFINLDDAVLTYNNKDYCIKNGNLPVDNNSIKYKCWCIGNKFYFDYAVCGFLSISERKPYGGFVHLRPEILQDIDNLLRTNLSEEWINSHFPYEVIATISGCDICDSSFDELSERDKVLDYILKAYRNAFDTCSENILIAKNGYQIPPDNILEIKPLSYWKRN